MDKVLPKTFLVRHLDLMIAHTKKIECGVAPDNGALDPEFIISKTLAELNKAVHLANCNIEEEDMFEIFGYVLTLDTLNKCEKVLNSLFNHTKQEPSEEVPPKRTTLTF